MLSEWLGPTISVRALTTYEISDELCRRQLQGCRGALRHDISPVRNVCDSQARRYQSSVSSVRSKTSFPHVSSSVLSRNYEVPLSFGRNIGINTLDCSSHQSALEYLSPWLSQKSVVTNAHSTSHVWLPRSSSSRNSGHSNSLPRLDKRETSCQTANTVSSSRRYSDHQRRRQYRIALNFFNKKPVCGIQYLIQWGFVENNSLAVANLLLHRRGLSKQMIGEYIGHLRNSFQSSVLNHFVDQIDLHGLEVDVALRHVLSFFRLPGEAQKIERIMQVFSVHYSSCNPDRVAAFHSKDTVFILAFAIIMLNTDLHSPNIKPSRKMKLGDFINNLRGIDAGHDIDRQRYRSLTILRTLLVRIYRRIRDSPFSTGSDHVSQVLVVDQSIIGKDKPNLVEPHRRLVCYCRLNQIVDRNKRQPANAHQREVFLFNDLLVIAKLASKKKSSCQYILRSWMTLLGLRISMFETPFYDHGIKIMLPDGQEIHLNSKTDDDRPSTIHRFVADVKESVAECAEMDALRIETELDKHSLFNRSDGTRERDSGLSEIEGNTSNSVMNISSPNTSQQALNSSFMRRLSFNSFDSGVIEEGCESFSHSVLPTVSPFYTSRRLEAAI
ncbi:unnamed protein product [Thelazia callipaeda]|uniref:SEC7 domain-containing protein n=1 Tax=Thelazia callipaeda TaxID=103827 RepID=A0A0N5D9C0_THECL|nr:unnamed protein product [Thelazia callipaeda]